MEFQYIEPKDTCWYNKICDKSKCGEDFCVRHYKMAFLTEAATMQGLQKYAVELKPDKDDYNVFVRLREIKNNISSFVSSGKNLLLYSNNTGNGKTEWAKKLLLSWFDSIWNTTDFDCRGLFISFPRFIAAMKENISKHNDYFEYVNSKILDADIVVWDEINYKTWTAFEQDYMLNVISQRLAMGKPNIYTTNFNLVGIEERLGSRLASRIIGCSEALEFKGSDKRNNGGDFIG